ncbi:MAG: protein kinase [Acidobacteria bacterium]|nr:protein kinase [Acidobacteriota bacterium]MCA1641010.1 protein kinase [Acidobacteriota bacterium]
MKIARVQLQKARLLSMDVGRWQKTKSLFHDALEREGAARAAFLDAACAGDAGLRREVEALIAAHEESGEFLDAPAYEAATAILADERVPALTEGRRLGHYRIVGVVGEGGMGKVYRALDERLGREVALKLLADSFVRDADRLRRFKQEARAASSLNHPNILTIHEIGEEGERNYIATELIEGETLRRRIARGRLPVGEALDLSIQVASALAAAHGAGVVHRDIKPENVMVRADGYVKVVDFGLAKLTERGAGARAAAREAGGWSLVSTSPGVVMGTVAYMSPEQARGADVDERTDVWSLGALLYEMIAGCAPFHGGSANDVLTSILSTEPAAPLARYAPGVPERLEEIVSKTLAKEREERYQSAKDLLVDLKRLRQKLEVRAEIERSAPPEPAEVSAAVHARPAALTDETVARTTDGGASDAATRPAPAVVAARGGKRALLVATSLAVALAVVGFGLYKLRGTGGSKPPAAAWKITPLTSFAGGKADPALSPDGQQIAFAWTGVGNDTLDIYVKLIGEGTPLRLTTNPARDMSPAWSPDGRHVAFIRYAPEGNSLMTVPSLGGSERKLVSLTSTGAFYLSAAWSPDGKEMAITDSDLPSGPTSIFLISLETGERRRLTTSLPQSGGDLVPRFSPDGRWVAFTRSRSTAVDDIYVVPAAGGEPRAVTTDGREISASGLDWTADGREIIFSSRRGGLFGLWRVSVAGGTPEPMPGIGENTFAPTISRRGDHLAYLYRKLDYNIWRAPGPNAANRDAPPTRHVASTRGEGSPRYSPDGQRIAFASDRSGNLEIWTCDAEGGSPAQLTRFDNGQTGSPRWSPDGQRIAFDARPTDNSDVYVVGADGGAVRRLTSEKAADIMPVWSTDGQWLYFGSDRGGDWQIWKMPAGGGEPVQVTKGGGFGTLSATDEFLYYSRRNALPTNKSSATGAWRLPLAGGEEERVFDQGTTGTMFITPGGVCFFDPAFPTAPTIKFYNFASRQVTTLVTLDPAKSGAALGSRLAVSPDGLWVLYSQMDQNDYEIMLVENFR